MILTHLALICLGAAGAGAPPAAAQGFDAMPPQRLGLQRADAIAMNDDGALLLLEARRVQRDDGTLDATLALRVLEHEDPFGVHHDATLPADDESRGPVILDPPVAADASLDVHVVIQGQAFLVFVERAEQDDSRMQARAADRDMQQRDPERPGRILDDYDATLDDLQGQEPEERPGCIIVYPAEDGWAAVWEGDLTIEDFTRERDATAGDGRGHDAPRDETGGGVPNQAVDATTVAEG